MLEVTFTTTHKWASGELPVTLRDVLASPIEVIESVATGLRSIAAERRAAKRSPMDIVAAVLRLGARTGQFQEKVAEVLDDSILTHQEAKELLQYLRRCRAALDEFERAVQSGVVSKDLGIKVED
jgi:hypothetical protein